MERKTDKEVLKRGETVWEKVTRSSVADTVRWFSKGPCEAMAAFGRKKVTNSNRQMEGEI